MRKAIRENFMRRSAASILAIATMITTVFVGCAPDNKETSLPQQNIKPLAVKDNTQTVSGGDNTHSNISRFKMVQEDNTDGESIGINILGAFPIYKDETGYFIWSNNSRFDLKNSSAGFVRLAKENETIVLCNNTGKYTVYDGEENLASAQEAIRKFLAERTDTEVSVVIDSNQMISVKYQDVMMLNSHRDTFDLEAILKALNIEYTIKSDRVEVTRFDYNANKSVTLNLPLTEKGQIIQDTCSEPSGNEGTNIITLGTFKEGNTYYADKSTLYDILGIEIEDEDKGYTIGKSAMVQLGEISLTENEPIKVVIDEVDDTEEYQYVEDTPTEFTDEQLLNRMDENTREWADRAGIVFEQTTDGSVTAQNALKAIQERFPTLTFTYTGQGIICEEYSQGNMWFDSPYASMTAEEVYAEMTAKYGTDPHCLDNISPEEWVKDIIPLTALTMLSFSCENESIVDYATGIGVSISDSPLAPISFDTWIDTIN